MADSTSAKVTVPTLYKINSTLASLGSLLDAWIIAIERLDRKLADAIGPNIVGKSDVTLSRAIQPLTSDVLRVFFFHHIFHISVLDMNRTCSWRKQFQGTKPVETKDRVNDYGTCEREEMTPAPDNFMHQTGSLTT